MVKKAKYPLKPKALELVSLWFKLLVFAASTYFSLDEKKNVAKSCVSKHYVTVNHPLLDSSGMQLTLFSAILVLTFVFLFSFIYFFRHHVYLFSFGIANLDT